MALDYWKYIFKLFYNYPSIFFYKYSKIKVFILDFFSGHMFHMDQHMDHVAKSPDFKLDYS